MWDFGLKDLIDILAVAAMMFYLYRWSKGNGTIVIFKGLIAIIVTWVALRFFEFRLLGGILDLLMSVSMIVIVVLFQNEIRQALIRIGTHRQWSSMLRFFGKGELNKNDDTKWVDAVVLACQRMSEHKVGALIIVQRFDEVEPNITTQGCEMDAIVSARLIEQVFFKNSPLHDGAMLIRHGRIAQAAAVLPISNNKRIPTELGLRHRSALGISEKCDAQVVVVSEETGDISLCYKGRITRAISHAKLQKQLLVNIPIVKSPAKS